MNRGADVNKCDLFGISPLMISINPWLPKALHYIYDKKIYEIDPTFELLGKILPLFNDQNLDTVEKLIKWGAKLYAKERFGNTPLMIAAISGNLKIVNLLISYKAELDAKDDAGATALLKAVKRGNHEVVKCLLQAGADPNQQKLNNATSLLPPVKGEPTHRRLTNPFNRKIILTECFWKMDPPPRLVNS
jgi:ankyrin repeat protein